MFGHVLFGHFQRAAAARAISYALILGAAAQAETFFWNPSTALLNSGADVNKTANWSKINDGGGAWPKSSFDDDFTSTTLNAAWKYQDRDNDNSSGSIATSGGQLTLTSRGKDIWTVDNEYVAAWRGDITGDFDVSVKISSLSNSNEWAKAGILVANDSANFLAGGCFAVLATPQRGIVIQFDSTGVIGQHDFPGADGPEPKTTTFPVWVRAAKKGGVFYGYFKRSLTAPWTLIRTAVPQVKAVNSHIGLFVTSHNVATTATAVFDDFQASGTVPANTMELSFNGTSTTADSNANLTAPLSAMSIDMTGYAGSFSFGSSTLTVTGAKADFSAIPLLNAGTGALAFTAASGTQVFSPRLGAVFPPIAKSGAGTLQVAAFPLVAGALTVSGGVLDLGGFTNQFAGINATAGAFTGMDANDTLIVTSDANFSGLTGFPAAGSVQIRSQATPSAAQILNFTPGTISFNHLYLWAIGAAQPARIVIAPGTLQVKGDLILRDESLTAGFRGVLDFQTHNPSVTVDGNIYRVDNGSGGAPSQQLLMGAGTWKTKGNVSLSFQNAGSADNSTLDLTGVSPAAQTLVFTGGPLANVKHSGSGTLSLGSPLSAKSLAHSAGVLNLNNNNITVTGDIAVTNGTTATLIGLGGRDVHADGNITLTGQAGNLLNLNPGGAWTISAGGTLNADFAAIARSTATATGSGNATSNCSDLGDNSGWIFAPLTTPPTIKSEPADATVLTGVTAEFTVAAEGAPPLQYEWRKRGDTATIARTATLTLLKAAAADSASLYYCTVLNAFGTKATRDAMLNVNDPAHITVQPVNVSVVEGNPAVFSLKAKGSRKLSFVWKKKSDGSTAPGDSVLTLPAVSIALNGSIWTCTVTNAFGETTSDEVTLTVNRIPSIIKQPVDLVVLGGQTARFSVAATGTDPLTFQWYRKSDLAPLTADSVLTITTAAGDDSARYYCVVKNLHGEATSYAAKLTVGVIPVIQAEPRDTSVVVGRPASFKVRAAGSAPLGFQWQKVGSTQPVGSDSVLSLGPTAFSDSGAKYFCVIANVYGKDTSVIATLKVNRPAAITVQPRDTAVAVGQKASFKVSATGSGKLTFKWRKKDDTTVVSPDSVLAFAAAKLSDSGSIYICTVSNDYGQVLTREAKLVVVQGALITREPIDISVGLGKKAVFTVGAVGANPMTFKWRRGSDTATLSKDSVFSLDSVKLSDDGALFKVIVKNDFGADTSRQARLNVVVCDSVFQVSPDSLTVDEGRPIALNGKAACSQSRFWTVISGPAPVLLDPEVDTLKLIAPRVAVDTVLVYRFTASYSGGAVSKNVVIKVRNAIPDPQFTLPAKSKWNGQTRLSIRPALTNSEALKASAYSPPFRYQWFLSIGIVDTAQAGDSLSLSDPKQDGILEVTLCLDNGGAVQCAVSEVEIDRQAVRIAGRRNVTGPIALSGGRITWNVSGSARVWNWQGRLLWEGRGRRGESAELPHSALRALRGRSARLEIRPD